MLRATRLTQASDPKNEVTRKVVLSFDDRYRRRHRLTTEDGFSFLLDLAAPVVLKEGDLLLLEDGQVVAVVAAREALMEAVPSCGLSMARMAWHIGNRHLEAEIYDNAIRLRRDHVIQAMLEQLGATVTLIDAPFSPEGGAYGHGRTHSHDHGHVHGLGHDHHDSHPHG